MEADEGSDAQLWRRHNLYETNLKKKKKVSEEGLKAFTVSLGPLRIFYLHIL